MIFKKRWFAVLAAVVVICLSTLFSVHRFLGQACQSVTDSFYSGVYNPAFKTTRPSVDSQLTRRYQAANGLYTMVSGNAALSDSAMQLRAAKNALLAAVSIPDKYRANEALESAFSQTAQAEQDWIDRSDVIRGNEQQMLDSYKASFAAAQGIIAGQSGYNDAVREFYRSTLDVFPANLLKGLIPNKLPVLFE